MSNWSPADHTRVALTTMNNNTAAFPRAFVIVAAAAAEVFVCPHCAICEVFLRIRLFFLFVLLQFF